MPTLAYFRRSQGLLNLLLHLYPNIYKLVFIYLHGTFLHYKYVFPVPVFILVPLSNTNLRNLRVILISKFQLSTNYTYYFVFQFFLTNCLFIVNFFSLDSGLVPLQDCSIHSGSFRLRFSLFSRGHLNGKVNYAVTYSFVCTN